MDALLHKRKYMRCLLVGAGYMAKEYLKVLKNFNIELEVVGMGRSNVDLIKSEFNIEGHSGGIETYFRNTKTRVPDYVIIAVPVAELFSATISSINFGIKNILVEKPLSLSYDELLTLEKLAIKNEAKISIAYNRRFYGSVSRLKKLVEEDGGVSSVNFEFTEWINVINDIGFPNIVLDKFFLANSSHVVDTVFNIIGAPQKIVSYVSGSSVKWHKSGSIFMGFGESIKGIPFSYSSNWGAPGRWAIEVLTNSRRFYLKPMEKLFIQLHGSVEVNEDQFENEIDFQFKAGIYKMVSAFLYNKDQKDLCTLSELKLYLPFYEKIAGYKTK
jgi:predicted dehydrogenase